MVNKKGFVRTLEAVIAIILIFGFLFYITPKVVEFEEKIPENIANAKEFIMNQILFNKEYGECILAAEGEGSCSEVLTCGRKDEIMALFEYIPYGYEWACEICEGSERCLTPYDAIPTDKSVFTNTVFIYNKDFAPGEEKYNIMRIYIWKA